jgi:hypothetical protein
MKIGQLVRFKNALSEEAYAVGLIVEIRKEAKVGGHGIGVLWTGVGWDVMDGKIGYQRESDIEVIDESR